MYVILLDPYISSNWLIEQFSKHRIEIFAYYFIDHDNEENASEDTGNYQNKIIFDAQEVEKAAQHIDSLIAKNGKNQLLAIISCDELMGEMHERLFSAIKYSDKNFSNPQQLWNNKFKAQQKLFDNGLSNYRQYLINLDTFDTNDVVKLDYPVFVKPSIYGVGTIGAKKCHDRSQLIDHLVDLKKFKNPLGRKITEVVVQEFINGTEVVIENVSYAGKHSCVGIHKYKKDVINNEPRYNYTEAVISKPLLESLQQYSHKVLDVLGYKNGPSHMEIMLDQNANYYFIELNPRFSGAQGSMNILSDLIFSNNQVDELIRMYSNQAPQGITQVSNKNYKVVYYYAPSSGYESIDITAFKKFNPQRVLVSHARMPAAQSDNEGLFRIAVILVLEFPKSAAMIERMLRELRAPELQDNLFQQHKYLEA